jgi:hypothetical protein
MQAIDYDGERIEFDATIRQQCDDLEPVEISQDRIVVKSAHGAKLRQSLVARGELDNRVLARTIED